MRIRYATAENGRPVKKAIIYTADEHGIDRSSVSSDALRVIDRLKASGHEAYIVGGAVRDLLVGKRPKDFDIVTDANPTRIKKLFRNARIIGRRFRLVHVFFGPDIYEVSTFRSLKDGTTSNTFGTIEEDVLRRDFTFNALYYDPFEGLVIDYVGGFADIKRRRVRPVIPLGHIFSDDPVRMVRAAKYAASTGFGISLLVRWKIRSQSSLLATVSPSRLTEEIVKIIRSGRAAKIIPLMDRLGLFAHLQPNATRCMREDPGYRGAFLRGLEDLDRLVEDEPDAPLGKLMVYMLRDLLDRIMDWKLDSVESYRAALAECRSFVLPMNPPRIELENAVRVCFRERGIAVKKARTFERGRRSEMVIDQEKAKADAERPAADAPEKKRRRRRRKKRPDGIPSDTPPQT